MQTHQLLLLSLVLALCACQSEPESTAATPATTDPAVAKTSPPPSFDPPTPAAPAQPAVDAPKPQNYLEQATARADQRLHSETKRCEGVAVHLQDDCLTSAHVQHEAALAAARVEYEAQLAEQQN